MDWALVLTSQHIEATVLQDQEEWGLLVEKTCGDHSLTILRQWEKENRGWKWQHTLPVTGLVFHWAGLLWAIAIVAIHVWSTKYGTKEFGLMDSKAVLHGEWWRLFTAVTLHADYGHLASNAVSGALLFGLAMARYGTGIAVMAGFVGGVLGNVLGLFVFGRAGHLSLGASGMVMAALGLLAVQSVHEWRKDSGVTPIVIRAIAAAVLILVLTGFSPEADILAHVGGFVGGAAIGFGLNWVSTDQLHSPPVNMIAMIALFALIFLTWAFALHLL